MGEAPRCPTSTLVPLAVAVRLAGACVHLQLCAYAALPKPLNLTLGSLNRLPGKTPAAITSQKSSLSAEMAGACWRRRALPSEQVVHRSAHVPKDTFCVSRHPSFPPRAAVWLIHLSWLKYRALGPLRLPCSRPLPDFRKDGTAPLDFPVLHSQSSSFAGEGLVLLINHVQ